MLENIATTPPTTLYIPKYSTQNAFNMTRLVYNLLLQHIQRYQMQASPIINLLNCQFENFLISCRKHYFASLIYFLTRIFHFYSSFCEEQIYLYPSDASLNYKNLKMHNLPLIPFLDLYFQHDLHQCHNHISVFHTHCK